MTEAAFSQVIALITGLLMLTGVLIVWRKTLASNIRLLSIQGFTLAALALVIAIWEDTPELIAIAAVVALLKGAVMPLMLRRAVTTTGNLREEHSTVGTNTALLSIALLTALAYLVSAPFGAVTAGPATSAVPIGLALVFFGFFTITTRTHAVSQLVGYLMIDNGIGTVAFLLAGGLPLVVELGGAMDVLLVVVILQVLTSRISSQLGAADLDDLTELRD